VCAIYLKEPTIFRFFGPVGGGGGVVGGQGMPANETPGVPSLATLGVAGVTTAGTGVIAIWPTIGTMDGSIMVITSPVSPPLLPVDAVFVIEVVAMSTKVSWS